MDSIDDNPFADLQSSFAAPKEVKEDDIKQQFKEVSLDEPSPANDDSKLDNDPDYAQETIKESTPDNHNDGTNVVNDDDDNESLSERKRSLSLQQSQRHTAPVIPVTETIKLPNGNTYDISVSDPQKIGNPANSYVLYTIRTFTKMPAYRQNSMTVLRRYSDFLWLYENLCKNNPGVFVPPPPSKQAYGRFKMDFIEQRRQALEKCLMKCANHPLLSKDEDLKLFLESDSFAVDVKQRQLDKAEGKSVLASWGSSIIGPKFIESDEWFDSEKQRIDGLEVQLKALVKALQNVSAQRYGEYFTISPTYLSDVQDLASSLAEYSESLLELSRQFIHSDELTKLFQMLADLSAQSKRGLDELVKNDASSFAATVDEYMRVIGSIKNTFSTRIKLYHDIRAAENSYTKKKTTYEKQKSVGQIHQYNIAYSLKDLAASEHSVHESKREFSRVSILIKEEMAAFDKLRMEDFKVSLKDLVSTLLKSQRSIHESWLNYERELKVIL
ncbi:Vps5-domain-containing protein [Wallemia mellicola]|nr:hypothetical protein E3Q24_03242 [Wallemia mellicola]TIB82532.1 Vps5-domain-containing protein [Wallemia mellicola]TIB84367.1 Vps5-domain-containing protein [Wallemia mellicola]TIC35922.1 Vps5-domain-containing protein [Wallemia mellicola]TIC39033.1 Vps5-domain-containing protein [Wallemia mellicola]